jgi:hypothetical protein
VESEIKTMVSILTWSAAAGGCCWRRLLLAAAAAGGNGTKGDVEFF